MNKPTKEQVREWQQQRQDDHTPPPPPEEIRRQLGWDLIPENKLPTQK
jgi:hypothetical protein